MTTKSEKMAIRRNLKLFPWSHFLLAFRPILPLYIILAEEVTGSYALAMMFITLSSVCQSIFEVPTGILSDRVGRRKTLLLGNFIDVLAVTSVTLGIVFQSLWGFGFAAVLQALAFSLYSGTKEALLYETLAQLKKKHKYHHVYGKVNAAMQASMASSALLGGFLMQFVSHASVPFIGLE